MPCGMNYCKQIWKMCLLVSLIVLGEIIGWKYIYVFAMTKNMLVLLINVITFINVIAYVVCVQVWRASDILLIILFSQMCGLKCHTFLLGFYFLNLNYLKPVTNVLDVLIIILISNNSFHVFSTLLLPI